MNLRYLIRELQRLEKARGDLPVRVIVSPGDVRNLESLCAVAGADGYVSLAATRKESAA